MAVIPLVNQVETAGLVIMWKYGGHPTSIRIYR